MNHPYPSPNRVYHRGSHGIYAPNPDGAPQLLLKACPIPPRFEGFCEPAHGLSMVYRVRIAPGQTENVATNWGSAFLIAEYGSGDPDVQRCEFDLMNSDAVPLVGAGVGTVNIYLAYRREFDNNEIPRLITPDLEIDISLAVSSFGSHGPRAARRTKTVGSLAVDTESAQVAVPPYAVAAYLRTNDITKGVTITWYATTAGGGQSIAVNVDFTKPEYQSTPVPNGARFFTLTSSTEVLGAGACFYLGSG